MASLPSHALRDWAALPDDCLSIVLRHLPLRDRFLAARVCRALLHVLLARPICGKPPLLVSAVTMRGYGNLCSYTIRYDGTDETDTLYGWAPKNAVSLIARFGTHFLVVFTLDHPFLAAWTTARRAAQRLQLPKESGLRETEGSKEPAGDEK